MNKKKILALVLVVVLLLTAVGGTLAYFTDTEEANNVFTVGNVNIALLESEHYEKVGGTDFTDEQIIASAEEYQEYLEEAGENVVPGRVFNKAIYIHNTGKNDAYVRVRVIITRDQFNSFYFTENTTALEQEIITKGVIAYYADGTVKDYSTDVKDDGFSTDFTNIKADSNWIQLEYIYTYTDALKAGDVTDYSPVWKFQMKNHLDNEDVVGLNTNIKVYADAIQSEGFKNAADAFAEYNTQEGVRYVASSSEALNKVITATTIGSPVEVELPAGEYTLPALTNKEVTISGSGKPEDTVIDTTAGVPGSTGAALTFEGVTLNFKDSTDYQGFTHSEKVVYKDCIINGTMFLYSNTEFINCTFNANGNYNVWTYGSNATFTNCTFNTQGRAILVYNSGEMHATVTVTGCTFNATAAYNPAKAAIEVGSSEHSTATTYEIIINNCTADNNFKENHSTSNLWGNKNDMDHDHLNVIVDGVDVY